MNYMSSEVFGYVIGIFLGSVIFGILFGLIPLITGIRREEKGLGIAGMIFTIIGSCILLGWATCIMGNPIATTFLPLIPFAFTFAIFMKSR